MKIGIVLDQMLQSGGGFQQSLSAIRQLVRICPSDISIEIFTTTPSNVDHPQLMSMRVHVVRRGIVDRIKVAALTDSSLVPSALASRLGVMSSLERVMLRNGVDIAYFLSPSNLALSFRRMPYILTVWDLCHRDRPEFPEVSIDGQFDQRERFYQNAINRSYLTLSDSEELSQNIIRRYGVDPARLIAMPFQPAGFVEHEPDLSKEDFLAERNLPADYLFYPAQFWPHKNHVRVLQAVSLLRQEGLFCSAVFCGGDKGNRGHVENMAKKLGIYDQIHFIGFVNEEDMKSLYSYSRALVMPTYFGPTNLPPMEAWAVGKPVIYSDACKQQVGDAALCVNPDSAADLADAIRRIYSDDALVRELISMGRKRLDEIEVMRFAAEDSFVHELNVFKQRMLCWGME